MLLRCAFVPPARRYTRRVSSKPLGERNYEQFAHRYAKHAKVKPHNALYERPATLSLLPEVAGRDVFDAGCGPGLYTSELVERGARVVAADVTPAMIELARQRVGSGASFVVADLAKPLDFAKDDSFDVVLSPLMLDYIEDWDPVFAEFFRVLRPGGHLVYSHSHPMSDYMLVQRKHDPAARYLDREAFSSQWGGFGTPRPTVKAFRRPLGQMMGALTQAGFILEQLLEPQPVDAMREVNPELFEALRREPCFLCVRARKPL